jgi:hypothetical protein
MRKIVRPAAVAALAIWCVVARGDELAERALVTRAVHEAWSERAWGRLDDMSRSFANGATTGSGLPKIVLFEGALSEEFDKAAQLGGEPALTSLEEQTLLWEQQHRASAFGVLLHAEALSTHAFFFRGDGWASTVPPEAWAPFKRYEAAAASFLLEHKKAGAHDAGWYAAVIEAAKCLDWDRGRVFSIAAEGAKRYRGDQRIHRAVIDYLSPKWHGDAAQLDDYINRVSNEQGGEPGLELYARLYINVATAYYEENLFEESQVDWPRMRDGLAQIVKEYPTPFNRNMFAHYACAAKDKRTLQALLRAIGDEVVVSRWGRGGMRSFLACKNWSTSPGI